MNLLDTLEDQRMLWVCSLWCCHLPPCFHFVDHYSSSFFFSFVVFPIISFFPLFSSLSFKEMEQKGSIAVPSAGDLCKEKPAAVRGKAPTTSHSPELPDQEPELCCTPKSQPTEAVRGTPQYSCRHRTTPKQHTTRGLSYRWQVMYFQQHFLSLDSKSSALMQTNPKFPSLFWHQQ